MDFGIIIIAFMGFIALVVLLMFPKQKREMSGAEKMSYEQERGRLQAQSEFNKRRW